MARKLVENVFFDFLGPPPKKNLLAVQKLLVKNVKNQTSSKLPEMAKKLVKNNFFTPPREKFIFVNAEISKLFQIT